MAKTRTGDDMSLKSEVKQAAACQLDPKQQAEEETVWIYNDGKLAIGLVGEEPDVVIRTSVSEGKPLIYVVDQDFVARCPEWVEETVAGVKSVFEKARDEYEALVRLESSSWVN
jgi:hypothetical protein